MGLLTGFIWGHTVGERVESAQYALFFRLETNEADFKERKGPYRGAPELSDLALAEYSSEMGTDTGTASDRHPMPYQDAKLAMVWGALPYSCAQAYVFGFDKLSQYRNWFCSDKGLSDIRDIACLGVYLVPTADHKLIPGQFQAAAMRAQRVHVYDLPTNYTSTDLDRMRSALCLQGDLV